jgi:hypothetical protein
MAYRVLEACLFWPLAIQFRGAFRRFRAVVDLESVQVGLVVKEKRSFCFGVIKL